MTKLDQIVKGAPAPDTTQEAIVSSSSKPPSTSTLQSYAPALSIIRDPDPFDPTQFLPSSPPQIYLNLLILEASLRAQYMHLLSRRRQNTSALTILAAWLAYFLYAQFFRPREDGHAGGSPYWVVDTVEKMALTGGAVLAVLFWATGQWERGVRWPRRWVSVTNRGLRALNCKVVVIRGRWWRETLGGIVCLCLPLAVLWPAFDGRVVGTGSGGEYERVEYTMPEKRAMVRQGHLVPRQMEPVEEDVAPGGDVVKLLLLPKPFSPAFRENWEVFRTEYWETENERRSELRKRVHQKRRDEARRGGGLLWWTGWSGWRGRRGRRSSTSAEDSVGRPHSHSHSHSHHRSITHQRDLKDRRRRNSAAGGRTERGAECHSRSSSRNTIVTIDNETERLGRTSDAAVDGARRRLPTTMREVSNASSTGSSQPSTPSLGYSGGYFGAGASPQTHKSAARKLSARSDDGPSGQGSGVIRIKNEAGTP